MLGAVPNRVRIRRPTPTCRRNAELAKECRARADLFRDEVRELRALVVPTRYEHRQSATLKWINYEASRWQAWSDRLAVATESEREQIRKEMKGSDPAGRKLYEDLKKVSHQDGEQP
jgi:hypothetical protein